MTIYSGFSHWKWWFSIVMLVYQRVSALSNNLQPVCRPRQLPRHLLWLGLNDLITEYHRCQKWWHLIRNHHRSWMIPRYSKNCAWKLCFSCFYIMFFSPEFLNDGWPISQTLPELPCPLLQMWESLDLLVPKQVSMFEPSCVAISTGCPKTLNPYNYWIRSTWGFKICGLKIGENWCGFPPICGILWCGDWIMDVVAKCWYIYILIYKSTLTAF